MRQKPDLSSPSAEAGCPQSAVALPHTLQPRTPPRWTTGVTVGAVAIDKSGEWWTSPEAEDLSEFLRAYRAGGYDVEVVQTVGACSCCGSASGYHL